MRKLLAINAIILLTLSSGVVFASGDDRGLIKKGDKEFKKAHLAEALGYYLKALTVDPKDCYANFQAGAIYYLTDSARIKSVTYFENTIKFAPANEDTIIDAFYYLGNCYILQKNYKQAILSFQKYLSHLVNDKTDRTIIKEVEHNIEICQSAPTLVQRPPDSASYFIRGSYQPVYVKNLGSLVNSPYPEYSQVTLNHDSTIVFTSRRPTSQNGKKDYMTGYYYEDIFTSHKDTSGQWSPPSLFSNQLHFSPRQLNLASVSLSPDGKTLFIYHKGLIYQSTKNGSAWSEPVRIGKHVKHIKRFMPTVFQSYDGKRLFLVSDKKGGYGGRDIYVCTINTDGTWSDPQNLGPDINTSFDEDAPFLLPDNKTLFFSSNGHKGLGGYDVFKSVYENGKWSVPQNVGAPINSTADDIFFTYDTILKTGYLSSSRINEGYGDMDLYSFSFNCDNVKNTVLQGEITYFQDKGISSATIVFTDTKSNQSTSIISDDSGKYSVQLKPDTKYIMSVHAPGFVTSAATVITPHQCDTYNLYQMVSLINILGPSNDSNDRAPYHWHVGGHRVELMNAFYRNSKPEYK
ncbi:MAG TPA: carboxypeptidase regulatory-like domain-containing protein, partial [Bacteroidia bacterium]|nr:carboxypeptidase regulatory-like domain-containing protein [Bacteroidia bacterium]